MHKKLFAQLFVCAFFCLSVVALAAPVTQTRSAPAFSLKDQNGVTHTLEQYKGKLVVLEWTNADCPFVKRHYEEGAMKNFAKYYLDRGVVWLAINSTHYADLAANKTWVEKNTLPYPVLSDQEGSTGKAYEAKTTPSMTVVDANGQIAYQGAFDDDPYADKRGTATNYVALALKALMENKTVEIASTKSYGCSVKYKS